jgi:hypothetical protein
VTSKFLVRRVVFGILALVFGGFTVWVVISTVINIIWPPAHVVGGGLYSPLWGFLLVMPFALLGLLFTWRFAVWHNRSKT